VVKLPARPGALRAALLAWFDAHRKPHPWRRDRDAYRVWIAEAMLQQTRIEVVTKAYERFLTRFPSLAALAAASEDDVLALWSGLGYYSRARALHAAARRIAETGRARFPDDLQAALGLPGVGAYTAAAVLSIAYDRPLAAVDGNVVRVLSRLGRLALPDGRGEPHRNLADRLLDRGRPGDWNQALMELGQHVCTPRAPRCEACPLARWCAAHRAGVAERHPPPRARRASERIGATALVLRDAGGRILLERGAFAHLGHLWLPPIRLDHAPRRGGRDGAAGALPRELLGGSGSGTPLERVGRVKHAILHRSFDVAVLAAIVPPRTLERAAMAPAKTPAATERLPERRVFEQTDLARIGRSSLLTKALHLAETARSLQTAQGAA
jgi:A/G-specific adenine glycosylase